MPILGGQGSQLSDSSGLVQPCWTSYGNATLHSRALWVTYALVYTSRIALLLAHRGTSAARLTLIDARHLKCTIMNAHASRRARVPFRSPYSARSSCVLPEPATPSRSLSSEVQDLRALGESGGCRSLVASCQSSSSHQNPIAAPKKRPESAAPCTTNVASCRADEAGKLRLEEFRVAKRSGSVSPRTLTDISTFRIESTLKALQCHPIPLGL